MSSAPVSSFRVVADHLGDNEREPLLREFGIQIRVLGEDGEPRAKGEPELPYKKENILGMMKARGGWLTIFFVGLVLAALVVEQFEHLLQANVELSYFVPLLIGHGGNTGSQSVATVIRAVALRQVGVRDMLHVIFKESVAGFLMGLGLGLVIYILAIYWNGLEVKIGLVVCISMPLVSAWANMLGGLLPLLSVYLGYNPAVTSAPLMTTVVDSSGLVIYFIVAASILQFKDTPDEETPLEKLIPNASPEALDFIRACIHWDPTKRPTAQQCLDMPFFSGMEPIPHSVTPSKKPEAERRSTSRDEKETEREEPRVDVAKKAEPVLLRPKSARAPRKPDPVSSYQDTVEKERRQKVREAYRFQQTRAVVVAVSLLGLGDTAESAAMLIKSISLSMVADQLLHTELANRP